MLFFDLFRHDPEFIEIKEGDILFRQGDEGNLMYVLIEGKADIMISGVLFGEYIQGSIVGEMAVIDCSPRYGTVTALTNCKFVKVDQKRFLFLIDETPGFAIEVIRIMAMRLKECDARVIQMLKPTVGVVD